MFFSVVVCYFDCVCFLAVLVDVALFVLFCCLIVYFVFDLFRLYCIVCWVWGGFWCSNFWIGWIVYCLCLCLCCFCVCDLGDWLLWFGLCDLLLFDCGCIRLELYVCFIACWRVFCFCLDVLVILVGWLIDFVSWCFVF